MSMLRTFRRTGLSDSRERFASAEGRPVSPRFFMLSDTTSRTVARVYQPGGERRLFRR